MMTSCSAVGLLCSSAALLLCMFRLGLLVALVLFSRFLTSVGSVSPCSGRVFQLIFLLLMVVDMDMDMDSPYRQDRDRARGRFNSGEFVEVHVSTSLKTCEERDPKDLYKKVGCGCVFFSCRKFLQHIYVRHQLVVGNYICTAVYSCHSYTFLCFCLTMGIYKSQCVSVFSLCRVYCYRAAEQARAGEITNMTGIAADAPYEAPENPEIDLKAEGEDCTVDVCADKLLSYLRDQHYLKSSERS